MGKHRSPEQEQLLTDFMSKNPDIAKGFVKGDKVAVEAKWEALVISLNAAGPPRKDLSGWKKSWADWKSGIRKKLAANKRESVATGGGPYSQQAVLPIEREIATFCGLYKSVDGIEEALVFGSDPTILTLGSSQIHSAAKGEGTDNSDPPPTAAVDPILEQSPKAAPKRRRQQDEYTAACEEQNSILQQISCSLKSMEKLKADHYKKIEATENLKLECMLQLIEAMKIQHKQNQTK